MQPTISKTDFVISDKRRWFVAFMVMSAIALPVYWYLGLAFSTTSTLFKFSYGAAAIASLMYATAFSMGSISYYIGWPQMRWGYQKQIGLMAYIWSFVYAVTLVWLYPELYGSGLSEHFFSSDVILGLSAMVIFTAMVIVPSKRFAPQFSPETIKFVLGLGFVAYALLVIRAINIEFDLWWQWLVTLEGYPPGRLVLSVIALVVLLMRISIPIHLMFKKKETSQGSLPTQK